MAVSPNPRIAPAAGLPSPDAAAEDAAFEALAAEQLANTRKAAENWRTGLAGLLGLLTTLSLFKAPTSIGDLPTPAAVIAGVLLFSALLTGVLGAWWSLRAAYGSPRLVNREEIRRAGGIVAYQGELAEQAVADLKRARIAAVTSLALAAAMTAVSWYVPAEVTLR